MNGFSPSDGQRAQTTAEIFDAQGGRPLSATLAPVVNRLSLQSVDILRGFAAVWVVLFHAHGFFWRNSKPPLAFDSVRSSLDSVVTLLLGFGWLGVPLFFVLSGFCILS